MLISVHGCLSSEIAFKRQTTWLACDDLLATVSRCGDLCRQLNNAKVGIVRCGSLVITMRILSFVNDNFLKSSSVSACNG